MKIRIVRLAVLAVLFATIAHAQSTVKEFVAGLKVPTSKASRLQAELFREKGLLSDEILEACYPLFWDVQAQLKTAIANAGGVVSVPTVKVACPQPLNMREAKYVRLECDDGNRFVPHFPIEGSTWPLLDMTGAGRSTVDSMRITVGKYDRAPPGCGIFLGRSDALIKANWNTLRNVEVIGHFGDGQSVGGASIVIIGCEEYLLNHVTARFTGIAGGAYYTGAFNIYRITSPYGPIAGGYIPGGAGGISNAGGTIDGSSHFGCDARLDGWSLANPDRRYIFWLGTRTHSVWIHDVYLTAKGHGTNGISAVFRFGQAGDEDLMMGGVYNIVIGPLHDEAYSARSFVDLWGQTRGVVLCNLGQISAGQLIGYGKSKYARRVDGIRLKDVIHRPHGDYWAHLPKAAAPGTNR